MTIDAGYPLAELPRAVEMARERGDQREECSVDLSFIAHYARDRFASRRETSSDRARSCSSLVLGENCSRTSFTLYYIVQINFLLPHRAQRLFAHSLIYRESTKSWSMKWFPSHSRWCRANCSRNSKSHPTRASHRCLIDEEQETNLWCIRRELGHTRSDKSANKNPEIPGIEGTMHRRDAILPLPPKNWDLIEIHAHRVRSRDGQRTKPSRAYFRRFAARFMIFPATAGNPSYTSKYDSTWRVSLH